MSFRVKAVLWCPVCDYSLTGATPVKRAVPPQPGDITICSYCFAVLEYTGDLDLREADVRQLSVETMIDLAIAIQAAKDYARSHTRDVPRRQTS